MQFGLWRAASFVSSLIHLLENVTEVQFFKNIYSYMQCVVRIVTYTLTYAKHI